MSLEKRNIVYVGGVDVVVTEEILHAAFIPFGDLKTIQIPRDFVASKFDICGFVGLLILLSDKKNLCINSSIIILVFFSHFSLFVFDNSFINTFVFLSLSTDKSRGFAFVEFESEEDAKDAIENMDGSELYGKVLRCHVAKALPKLTAGKAVWNSEEWIQSNLEGDNGEDEKVQEVTLIPSSHNYNSDQE